MDRLADKIYREVEENTLLKEDLRRTKLQLSQEKRLNKALKQRKVRPLSKLPTQKLGRGASQPKSSTFSLFGNGRGIFFSPT